MIKAVIFDLDNTLIDFMKFKKACISASVDAMIAKGLKISKEQAMGMIFEIYHEYGFEYQTIFEHFLKKAMGETDFKLIATAISAYRKEKVKHMKPYDNVVATLKKLRERGIKLAIVTDAPKFQAYTRLADLDLLYEFDTIICFEDTYERKPSSAPFKKALSVLKLEPAEVLMIGDMPARDIAGAKAMGMKTALAVYGLAPEVSANIKAIEPKADWELHDISDLVKILSG
ncbi:MAG: HAD-IIIA family hydrolase [archaeon]